MAIDRNSLGGRLPLSDRSKLNEAQKKLYESIRSEQIPWAQKAGFQAETEERELIGPFNAFLLRPEVAAKFLEFATAVAKQTSLSERIREVVILAVGAVWGASYEVYAHAILAGNAGVSKGSAKALAEGNMPAELNNTERVAWQVAHQLSTAHRLDDALYQQAEEIFGSQGLFDMAILMGEYHTTCTVLNLFAVPAPE